MDPLRDVNVLTVRPVRAAEWEDAVGRVTVLRPRPAPEGLRGVVRWLLYQMAAHRVRLDEIGSFAWRRMDGDGTVADLALALRAEFGERVEPAEQRLGHLVRVMRREGLVTYRDWDRRLRPS